MQSAVCSSLGGYVRSDHLRGTTWGEIGSTPIVKDNGDRFGIKLIFVVSPPGNLHFAMIEGQMNVEKFTELLKKLQRNAGKPIIVIADNTSHHTSGKVMRFAQRSAEKITWGHLPT